MRFPFKLFNLKNGLSINPSDSNQSIRYVSEQNVDISSSPAYSVAGDGNIEYLSDQENPRKHEGQYYSINPNSSPKSQPEYLIRQENNEYDSKDYY